MGAKHLSKDVQELVIEELCEYRALKVKIKNVEEQEKEGVVNLFPTLIQCDRENMLKYKQIERALQEALDPIEKDILERKYINSTDSKDIDVFTALSMKKGTYYKKKKTAIFHLAKALGII
jgi:ArpU family phage transcriptional regulator